MNLVEQLRIIVEDLGWKFHYGRRDFQNLIETESENDLTPQFLLDPVRRTPNYSDAGLPTGTVDFEGYFILLTKSDIDEEYDNQKEINGVENGKWHKHIKPKIDEQFRMFENRLLCIDELQIVRMSVTDVINVFDENMDGILINYKYLTIQ